MVDILFINLYSRLREMKEVSLDIHLDKLTALLSVDPSERRDDFSCNPIHILYVTI